MIVPSFLPHCRYKQRYSGINVHQFPGFSQFLYSRVRLFVRSLHLLLAFLSALKLHKKTGLRFAHAWNPLAGLAAAFFAKFTGLTFFIDFTDFYSDIAATDSPIMTPVFRRIERFVLHSASKIITVSDVMRRAISHLYEVPLDGIHVIPDGTDAEMFRPEADGSRVRRLLGLTDEPLLVYHGDVKPPDGVDVLLKAFRIVVEKQSRTKLMIIGGGGSYFAGLKDLAQELGIGSAVIFTGWIPHADVPEYLAAADVGVMPLRATLNHRCYVSFKLFEYWGVGRTVVVSRVDALSAIIQNGVNGILVEPEDVESLAMGLLEVIRDYGKARMMGVNGRKLVEERFNWQSLMSEEVRLYDEVQA